jgi:hypothetical protein
MRQALFFGLLLLLCCAIQPMAAGPAKAGKNAKPLFCAYGSLVGFRPIPPPPRFESEFAVAVVEINSSKPYASVTVSDFTLFDQAGMAIKAKRVVSVEEFDEPKYPGLGRWAYYMNTAKNGHTRPWNGVLPAGRIRLRVRVAFAEPPIAPVRFRLTVGRHAIEGRVDGGWPT